MEGTTQNRVFTSGVRLLEKLASIPGKRFYWKVIPRLIESLDVVYDIPIGEKTVRMHCGGEIARWRAENFLSIEPDTLQWIQAFEKNDVLLDIGANVGSYTLYASVVHDITVISVEPSPQNFAELTWNIHINDVGGRVFPVCAAATAQDTLNVGHLAPVAFTSGGSGVVFGDNRLPSGASMDVKATQYLLGLSMDTLVDQFGAPQPNHLKLDVSGATQVDILKGSKKILSNQNMRSAMIEIPKDDSCAESAITCFMKGLGFAIDDSMMSVAGRGKENTYFRR